MTGPLVLEEGRTDEGRREEGRREFESSFTASSSAIDDPRDSITEQAVKAALDCTEG